MSFKRMLVFNELKEKKNYSSMTSLDIEKIIKKNYKNASKYIQRVCANDLIQYSLKKIDDTKQVRTIKKEN